MDKIITSNLAFTRFQQWYTCTIGIIIEGPIYVWTEIWPQTEKYLKRMVYLCKIDPKYYSKDQNVIVIKGHVIHMYTSLTHA